METKTAWIIGTGPSLRNIDVSKLKDQDTITFNRAYIAFEEWGFEPTYYLSIDSNDLRSMYKDLNNLILNSNIKTFFLPTMFDNLEHPEESFQDGDKKEHLFVDSEKVYTIVDIPEPLGSANLASLYDEDTVIDDEERKVHTYHDTNGGLMGLKILKALGYNEIAFVGCDARYRDDKESNKHITISGREYISHADHDVNHFRSDYFGKGTRFGKPNEKWLIALWAFAAKQLKHHMPHIKVYSCTENSNLNKYYHYIPFEKFLEGERE